MKYKKVIAFICLLLSVGALQTQAQNNTLASGGNASGSGGTVSYSIGQVDYIEATGSGGSANQGVQQPIEIFVLGIDDHSSIELTATVFPNPTTNFVTLSIKDLNLENLSYHIYDLYGRRIQSDKISGARTIISMEGLQIATYFLSVTKNNSPLKTFKIIKN